MARDAMQTRCQFSLRASLRDRFEGVSGSFRDLGTIGVEWGSTWCRFGVGSRSIRPAMFPDIAPCQTHRQLQALHRLLPYWFDLLLGVFIALTVSPLPRHSLAPPPAPPPPLDALASAVSRLAHLGLSLGLRSAPAFWGDLPRDGAHPAFMRIQTNPPSAPKSGLVVRYTPGERRRAHARTGLLLRLQPLGRLQDPRGAGGVPRPQDPHVPEGDGRRVLSTRRRRRESQCAVPSLRRRRRAHAGARRQSGERRAWRPLPCAPPRLSSDASGRGSEVVEEGGLRRWSRGVQAGLF